ncbi:hypothetical protein HJC10_31535 [Corallococcus exiguus]|nr:hypothetical protein [Corallococcus exiguus]
MACQLIPRSGSDPDPQKLPGELKKKCLVVHIDLSKADPDPKALPSYLKSQTLLAIQQRLFKGGSPGYDELKGIFFDEYQALARGPLKPLKESRPEEFNIEFGRRLEKSVQDQEGYLRRLLHHVRWSRKKLLCVIFDNADHFNDEFQSVAFLQAQWTAGLGRMLLLLPMRDTTYWRARQQSAFHAVRNTILYLPRPALAKVLEKRFEFAIGELSKGDKTSIRSLRGFRIGIKNPAELLHTLHKTFTKDLYISRSMAMLATGDIREALRLFEACVSSPQLDLDKLLAAYLSDGNYRLGRTAYERAVFLGDWEQFSQDRSRRVCNLFCCPREAAISPLLGFRVLMRCYELRNQETTKADKGFESVEGLLSFFSTLGVPRSSTDKALGALLYSGLLEPYDLGSLGPDFDGSGTGTVKFVKLSSSGRLHRQWVENSVQYGLAMCDDVQIFDEDELTALRERSDRRNLALRRRDFAAAQAVESEMMSQIKEYVLRRDSELMSIPDSDVPAMKTQKMIDSRLASWVQAGRGKQFDEPLE